MMKKTLYGCINTIEKAEERLSELEDKNSHREMKIKEKHEQNLKGMLLSHRGLRHMTLLRQGRDMAMRFQSHPPHTKTI